MEGVIILKTYEVISSGLGGFIFLGIAAMTCLIVAISYCLADINGWFTPLVCGIVCFAMFFISAKNQEVVSQYEAYVDTSIVDMEEFANTYKIIEVKDNIWTIQDKEIKE